ncbi:MAG: hypothetical protein ACTSU5_17500 [Promethearchaeota archaeon]
MRSSFALIVDDSIAFSSDERQYPRFEVVIFANALNQSLSRGTWGLHKIVMDAIPEDPDSEMIREEILVKPFQSDGHTILYCVNGTFGDKPPYEILDMFEKRISAIYKPELLTQMVNSKGDIFKNIATEITDFLHDQLDALILDGTTPLEEFPKVPPRVHYLGISSLGLPIVSRMYDEEIIRHTGGQEHPEMSQQEYFESVLSAKCATIVMNSIIRAQAEVKSIQLKVGDDLYHFIYFRTLGNYAVELFASGNPESIETLFDVIIEMLEKSPVLQETFKGDLKPYASLKDIIDNLPEKLARKLADLI